MRSPCDFMSWQDKVNLSCRRGGVPHARFAGGTTAFDTLSECVTRFAVLPLLLGGQLHALPVVQNALAQA